ncbi:MAG: YicC family protein [Oxalobacter sp.]|jgi:uncharacterized protein (TIGR00255 family)|nr:MAG: YicC family protein [Oxalobacter sp.]
MTGYAITTRETTAGTITVEVKSVNSRFLDLQFRMNDDLRTLEPALRESVGKYATRGKVECRLSLGRAVVTGVSQSINQSLLDALERMQNQVRERFVDASPLSVSELLRWPGVIEEASIGEETLQSDVMIAMSEALAAFVLSREREGAALQAMLLSRVAAMEEIVERITPLVPQVVSQFQQKAIERMQEALGLAGEGGVSKTLSRDEAMDRIRQEVTLYGVRIDVSEELTRMKAHLQETRRVLEKGGAAGKRLDFMMQELNREANTLGSKAAIKELSDASIELKLLIEQMREQVQNLE